MTRRRERKAVEDLATAAWWMRDIPWDMVSLGGVRYDGAGLLVVDCDMMGMEYLPPKACEATFDGGINIDRLAEGVPFKTDPPTFEQLAGLKPYSSGPSTAHIAEWMTSAEGCGMPIYGTAEDVPLPAREAARVYDRLCLGTALRTAADLLGSDMGVAVETACVNVFAWTGDPATGQDVRTCLLSLEVGRETMRGINLAGADPAACFKHLGGRSAGRPSQLRGVEPFRKVED